MKRIGLIVMAVMLSGCASDGQGRSWPKAIGNGLHTLATPSYSERYVYKDKNGNEIGSAERVY